MIDNDFAKKHYKTTVKQTMSDDNTVIAQMLKHIPRHEFDALAVLTQTESASYAFFTGVC